MIRRSQVSYTLLIIAVAGLLRGPMSAAEAPCRTINFPDNREWAVGQVCVVQPSPGLEEYWKNLREIGPARGPVKVPLALPVCLVVGFDGVDNLNALNKLGANDIQVLWFKGTNLQTKNIKQLSNLRGLRALDCSSTDVSSDALPIIAKFFPELEALDIARTVIKDANIKELSKLKKLTFLSLHHNNITDAGARELGLCKNLRNLNLRGTQVTDGTASSIAMLHNLEVLNFLSTNLSDAGFAKFSTLKKLKHITVSETHISKAAIARLKSALPKCVVDARPDHHK